MAISATTANPPSAVLFLEFQIGRLHHLGRGRDIGIDHGAEFVRCEQYELGKKPLPANYMPLDYMDVDAVAPAMGSHLVDTTGPEFNW